MRDPLLDDRRRARARAIRIGGASLCATSALFSAGASAAPARRGGKADKPPARQAAPPASTDPFPMERPSRAAGSQSRGDDSIATPYVAPKGPYRSIDAREESTFAIHLMPIAFLPRYAFGGTVGLFLGGRLYTEVYYEHGIINQSDESSILVDGASYSTEMRAGNRWLVFLGNTFHAHVGLGVDYTKTRLLNEGEPASGFNAAKPGWDMTFDYAQADFEVGIGNRWMAGPVSLGASWITVQGGLFPLYDAETVERGEAERVAEERKDHRKSSSGIWPHIKFYAGWRF